MPYRLWHRLSFGVKAGLISIVMTCTIPYIIYQTICMLERRGNKVLDIFILGEIKGQSWGRHKNTRAS